MITASTISFFLLCALALTVLIAPRIRWWVKLPIVVAAPLLTFVVWHAAGSFNGWPADITPPKHSIFVAAQIYEPDPALHDRGEIVLWLIPLNNKHTLFGYRPNGREARAYRVGYSRELHEQIEQAMEMGKKGQTVELDRGEGHGRPGAPSARVPRWAIRRYQLPPSVIPTKEPR